VKLDLGAGPLAHAGFVAVDIEATGTDLGIFPWDLADNSVSEILASHVLEHFDRHTGRAFLSECWRILQPGGVLRLAVPDFDVFADCIVSGDWRPVAGYKWTDANHFFGGDATEHRPHWRHKYAYTFGLLEHILRGIGFVMVTRRGPCELDNMQHAAFSLYLDALR
jgi:predicted SAM-dependent methyltransferase